MTIYGNEEETARPVFTITEISRAAASRGDVCVVTGEISSVKYLEAAANDDTYVKADVFLDDGGLLTDVEFHYHCETCHAKYPLIHSGEALRIGFEAFRDGDRVVLLKNENTYTIVGFEDGLPHPCYKGKVFRVANAYIDLAESGLINGPLPDARISEAPEDYPGIVLSPAYILYGVYSSESIQLFVIGGTSPFKWKVENITPCADDTEDGFAIQPITYMIEGYSNAVNSLPKTPFSGLAGPTPEEPSSSTVSGYFTYRTAVLAVNENVLGMAKITITDYFGHETYLYVRVPCCFQSSSTGEYDVPAFDSDSIPSVISCGEYFKPTYHTSTVSGIGFSGTPFVGERYPISLSVESGTGSLWPDAKNELLVLAPDCDDTSEWESPIVICGKCRDGRTGTEVFDCDSIDINFCDPPTTIVATDTQMNCGESQTLSTADGRSYSWRKVSGNGSLSASTGASVTFTAPSCGAGCNPSCQYNAIIELVCMPGTPREVVMDTITIVINCYTTAALAYMTCDCNQWCVFIGGLNATRCYQTYTVYAFDCAGEPYGQWSGSPTYRCSWYYLMGHRLSCDYAGGPYGLCTTGPCISKPGIPVTPSHCVSWGYPQECPGPFEARTSSMITAGCCPEEMM